LRELLAFAGLIAIGGIAHRVTRVIYVVDAVKSVAV
jgi:hypothetical protein